MDGWLEVLGITKEFGVMMFRMIMVFICCFCIGYERDKKGENAGIRTHVLVGLGSCSMILLNLFVIMPYAEVEGIRIDLARIPSYIISGIGFLGAGTIITNQKRVQGLSTAATIWVVAIIGIVIGFGMVAYGIVLSGLVIMVLHWLKKIEI